MAQYSQNSPLSDVFIRKIVGSAIYAEIALAAGCRWQDTDLEEVIDKRFEHDKEFTGIYRKMLLGVIPTNEICNRIQVNLGCGNLIHWRDHPFWRILYPHQPTEEHIAATLKSTERHVFESIWPKNPRKGFIFPKIHNSNDKYEQLAKFNNFSALISLSAYARVPIGQFLISSDSTAAKYSRKIFSRVVCNTPHLFIRWPFLIERYINLVWTSPLGHYFIHSGSPEKDCHTLINEILKEEKASRKRGVNLPPKQLVRRINKDQLRFIQ